ncbi:MAG: HU family DNA-binding protein [bacterium]
MHPTKNSQRRNAMNKAELVEEVADQTGLTKKTSREAVDAITSAITDSLAREEKVTLVGFGTFQVMKRKARRGRNPQTGRELQIPAKKVPKFKAGRSLKEAVE